MRVAVVVGGFLVGVGAVASCAAFTGTSKDEEQPPPTTNQGDARADGVLPVLPDGPDGGADGASTINDGNIVTLDVGAEVGNPCLSCASRMCTNLTDCDPLVFVTSGTFTAGQIKSTQNADTLCTNAAAAANRKGVFRAWLSGTGAGETPDQRFMKSTRPYRRMDTAKIADSYADLVGGTIHLDVPISINEKMESVGSPVWTSTTSNGYLFGETCDDWNNTAATTMAMGRSSEVDSKWSFDPALPAWSCGDPLPLYCFEQLP